MVGYDIPLNQGCLSPIEVIIPDNSILSLQKRFVQSITLNNELIIDYLGCSSGRYGLNVFSINSYIK